MVDVRFVQSNRYPEKRVIILRNLKPGAGHEFRVRAINSYGIGAPSLPSSKSLMSRVMVIIQYSQGLNNSVATNLPNKTTFELAKKKLPVRQQQK